MRPAFLRRCILLCFGVLLAVSLHVRAAPLSAFNLLVVEVADKTSDKASAVSLREFNWNGGSVQTIAVPSTGADRFTLSGNSVHEGTLSAANGFLTLAGYRRTAGSSNPAAEASIDAPRVAARIDSLADTASPSFLNTTTALTDAFDGISVRGAATNNGNQFWLSGQNGTGGGVRYAGSVGATTSTEIVPSTNNLHQISVQGNNLFVGGATTTPGKSVFQVGSGLPTVGPAALTAAMPPTGGISQEFNSFFFTKLSTDAINNWNGTGFDTVYAVGDGHVAKFTYDGTTNSWTARADVGLTNVINIAGITIDKEVFIWVTTSGAGATNSKLFSLVDSGGYTGTFTAGNFTQLVELTGNSAFRGIAIVPEPGSVLLCGAAGVGLAGLLFRRRKSIDSSAVAV